MSIWERNEDVVRCKIFMFYVGTLFSQMDEETLYRHRANDSMT